MKNKKEDCPSCKGEGMIWDWNDQIYYDCWRCIYNEACESNTPDGLLTLILQKWPKTKYSVDEPLDDEKGSTWIDLQFSFPKIKIVIEWKKKWGFGVSLIDEAMTPFDAAPQYPWTLNAKGAFDIITKIKTEEFKKIKKTDTIKPLKPEILACAIQDKMHIDSGVGRAAKTTKVKSKETKSEQPEQKRKYKFVQIYHADTKQYFSYWTIESVK